MGQYNSAKQMVIDKPKIPVIRYRVRDESKRKIDLDLRGIRNPHSPFNGRLNPSKGNKKRWLSPEHLQCLVNEYFESCNGPLIDRQGQLVYDAQGSLVKTQVKPYTVSGLALYLGIKTDTMRRYTVGKIDSLLDEMKVETDPEHLTYASVILKAKQRIEAYAEGRLYDHEGQRGAQFVLDNVYGWVSNKEQADIELAKANAEKTKAEIQLKRDEFNLKKQLLDTADEDNEITIRVVRGKREDSNQQD